MKYFKKIKFLLPLFLIIMAHIPIGNAYANEKPPALYLLDGGLGEPAWFLYKEESSKDAHQESKRKWADELYKQVKQNINVNDLANIDNFLPDGYLNLKYSIDFSKVREILSKFPKLDISSDFNLNLLKSVFDIDTKSIGETIKLIDPYFNVALSIYNTFEARNPLQDQMIMIQKALGTYDEHIKNYIRDYVEGAIIDLEDKLILNSYTHMETEVGHYWGDVNTLRNFPGSLQYESGKLSDAAGRVRTEASHFLTNVSNTNMTSKIGMLHAYSEVVNINLIYEKEYRDNFILSSIASNYLPENQAQAKPEFLSTYTLDSYYADVDLWMGKVYNYLISMDGDAWENTSNSRFATNLTNREKYIYWVENDCYGNDDCAAYSGLYSRVYDFIFNNRKYELEIYVCPCNWDSRQVAYIHSPIPIDDILAEKYNTYSYTRDFTIPIYETSDGFPRDNYFYKIEYAISRCYMSFSNYYIPCEDQGGELANLIYEKQKKLEYYNYLVKGYEPVIDEIKYWWDVTRYAERHMGEYDVNNNPLWPRPVISPEKVLYTGTGTEPGLIEQYTWHIDQAKAETLNGPDESYDAPSHVIVENNGSLTINNGAEVKILKRRSFSVKPGGSLHITNGKITAM